MHVTIGDLRAAMGDLGALEADQAMKNHLTVQGENILASSASGDPEAVLRNVASILSLLNAHQPWYDSGRGIWGPRYSPSQIVRQNLQQSQTNAISRRQSAAGQTPVRQVSTAPAKEVSVWAETAKNLPAAVVARAEEIKRGDVYTAEQRQVVAAPAAAVGVPSSAIPQATAPSQPIPDPAPSSEPGWWARTVDFAFTGPAPAAPAQPTAPAPAPPPQPPAAPAPAPESTYSSPPQESAPTSSPSLPLYSPPPPERSFFTGQDITKMIQSAVSAAGQVGTAAAQAQLARAQSAADRRAAYAQPAPQVYYRPAAPAPTIGTNEIVAIGAGVALLVGVGVLAVVMSQDDED